MLVVDSLRVPKKGNDNFLIKKMFRCSLCINTCETKKRNDFGKEGMILEFKEDN